MRVQDTIVKRQKPSYKIQLNTQFTRTLINKDNITSKY